jgi:competence protein ComFC
VGAVRIESKGKGARFAWPPAPAQAARHAPADAGRRSPAGSQAGPIGALGAAIEEDLLGLVSPPVWRRLVEGGWAPDSPDIYCPRCASAAGPYEADSDGCPSCRSRRLAWEGAVRLGPYAGVLRESIHDLKFNRRREPGRVLGRLLGEAVAERMSRAGLDARRATLVPVPMSFRRRLARGVDHALEITRGVAASTGAPVARALQRRHRPPQWDVPLSERGANVAGSFSVRPGGWRLGDVVVVVDDVRTTGATLTAACRALRKGCPEGAGVWVAVVAVAEPGVRRGGG